MCARVYVCVHILGVCTSSLSRPSGPLQHGGEGRHNGLKRRPLARVVVPTRRQQRGEVLGPLVVDHGPVVQLAHLVRRRMARREDRT